MPKRDKNTKICTCCGKTLPTSSFNKDRTTADGLYYWCVQCAYSKELRRSGKKRSQQYKKKYRAKDRKSKVCPHCHKRKLLTSFHHNKRTLDKADIWCKECKREYDRQNRDRRNAYNRKRIKENLLVRLITNLRSRLRQLIKQKSLTKSSLTTKYLGCTIEELKVHIEKQWLPGMTWSNNTYKGWHIDHIKPLALVKTEEDLYTLFHYTNLQPLWAKDNLEKADTYHDVLI